MTAPRVLGRTGERGSATLEAAVIVPALLVLLGLVVVGGRLVLARGSVQAAARQAARAASLARSPAVATVTAEQVATQTLDSAGLACTPARVRVDTAGFAAPLGVPAVVAVSVSCRVLLADVAAPGTPGARELTARFTSPLDPYRGRAP